MTPKTCLRCDWNGETTATRCPSCAEPLFELRRPPSEGARALVRGHPEERSRAAASTAIVAPSSAPPRPPNLPPDPADHAEPTTTGSRSLIALVVSALVLTFAVGSWLQAHQEPSTPRRATVDVSSLSGVLVYAVPDGEGHSRLWRWELATGRVVRGPRVLRATELVGAGALSFGALGVTSELADGRLRASALRFLGPDDRAEPLLTGDMIAWGPSGATVAAGRRGPMRPGCSRRVAIVRTTFFLAPTLTVYRDPALCGDLLSIGQESIATLLTLERRGQLGVFFVGSGRIHPLLLAHALVGVSRLSDLLVVPRDSFRELSPMPSRPSQEHDDLTDAALFFRGLETPLPYVDAGEPFSIARVLAWSPDSATALIVGRSGYRRGIYELDVAPGNGLDAPSYVGPVSGIPYATFTRDGTPIVQTADGLFVVRGGSLVRLSSPVDAPAPDGPMAWIH
jgi:hypothetical protein